MTQRRRPKRPSLILALAAGALLSAAIVNTTSELRVVDGDTIDWGWRLRLEKARYRLAGYDAPETRGAKCASERALGKRATERLRALVAGGGVSVATLPANDKYSRQIASLSLRGGTAAQIAIREGWGQAYDGRGKRAGWCVE